MRDLLIRMFARATAGRLICPSTFFLMTLIGTAWIYGPSVLFSADEPSPPVVEWIRTASESGALTVDFYDPAKRTKAYPGWTEFQFTLEYKFNHQTRWKSKKGNHYSVTIIPTFTFVEPTVTHAIQLPRSIDASTWHESVLGSHELDHVAIGSHPRLILLSTHLLKTMGTLSRNAATVQDVTQKWVDESIRIEVDGRSKAIQQLISHNNEKLDELTQHGGRAIRERDAFFDRLYLKENLDESKFRYLGESLKLLETEEYRNATSLFKQK